MAVLFLAACSRKKNTFLSRNTHAVFAEYNALYNGNIAFDTGIEEVERGYRDDFWETLPIERIELLENNLPGDKKNQNFNIAEEKATKAIQKHSVYVDGKEYNPQIDEAYILLGKARYYDTRFIQALDAFNFILNKYPTSNSINHAKVWKAKTNIRLNNEEVAIENLKEMFKLKEISKEDYADASAIIAQAFINLDSLETALPYIKQASENVKSNELKGRYLYITGQLYNSLELIDSANLAFDEVIALNRKSPRVYMINAYIEKAKNFDFTKEDRVAFLELLYDLEKDRENRPFLDKIYNQIGEYYRKNDSMDFAIEYYNKSLDAYREDRKMQSVNYQTLAEIYFDFTEYKIAGAYYDSTLTNLDEGTRIWRRIKKKRENLDDVILYEDIAYENDSILRIVNMSESQQLAYFTEYTNILKQQAIQDSIALADQQQSIENQEFFNANGADSKRGGPNSGGTFYFYNPTTLSFGRQEFVKRWGNRKLEDNWRLSNKLSKIESLEEEDPTISIEESKLFQPETYIALIPKEEQVVDSIIKERNFAYYQLGLIYKEKFKEYDLSINRLETLLSFNPEERLVLPSLYFLHKIYLIQGDETKAAQYKNEIITRYPDSRYAEILRNPNAILATDESSPEFKYGELYKDFENSKYQHVIEKCDTYIGLYFGNPIIPKFELLKSDAIGRQQGYEAYKIALNFVALNYPNSDEGKEAQNLYENLLPRIANKTFMSDDMSDKWKIVYSFNKEDREAAEAHLIKLNEAIDWYQYKNMSTSIDYYNPDTLFVIIHGLNSRLGGRGFAEVLKEDKKFKINNAYFEISSPNYTIVQIHKNLEDYLNLKLENTTTEVEDKKSIEEVEIKRKERVIQEKKEKEKISKDKKNSKPTIQLINNREDSNREDNN